MKKGKINLRSVSNVMDDKEMESILGGIQVCSEGNFFDWYYMRCMPDHRYDDNPKQDACYGLNEGDYCSFLGSNGGYSGGRCLAFAPNYVLHCSNLI